VYEKRKAYCPDNILAWKNTKVSCCSGFVSHTTSSNSPTLKHPGKYKNCLFKPRKFREGAIKIRETKGRDYVYTRLTEKPNGTTGGRTGLRR
jgi:hypothetical protein